MRLATLVFAIATGALLPVLGLAATTPTAPATAVHYHAVLFNSQGQHIDQGVFDAALRRGQRYVSKANPATGEMALRLLPVGVGTPDSFAPTDRKHLAFTWIEHAGHHYSVEFHDSRGQRINRSAFTAGATQGQRYTETLDSHSGTAVLTLLPVGSKPSGSQPTSAWVQRRAR